MAATRQELCSILKGSDIRLGIANDGRRSNTVDARRRTGEPVFEAAAKVPIKNMQVGVIYYGPPFDLQKFVNEIGART